MKTFFKQYFFFLDKEAKRNLPLLLFIFLFSSMLDVISMGLVMAFLALIVHFDVVIHKLPYIFQNALNHFSKKETIFSIGVVLIFAFIFKGFCGVLSQKKLVYFISKFTVRLKMRLMTDYQNADYAFHLKQNSAYLLNKISLANSFSNTALSTLLNMISSILILIGIIACLIAIHPIVTLFLILMVGLIFISYEVFIKHKIVKMAEIMAISGGEINKSIMQALGGLKEIRVLGKEAFFLDKVNAVSHEYSYVYSLSSALQLIPRYAVESAASIFLVVLLLGALMIGISPVDMIPTLGIFATASIRLLPTCSQLIAQFTQLRSTNYITGLLYDELTELEGKYKTTLSEINTRERQFFSQFSLRDVSFCYDKATFSALKNINLTLFRGKSIGLMGSSGAGKSTLVSAFLGLLTPSSGELLVDGFPIPHIRQWLNNFAYIPQSIFLLDETLKRNIALGTDDHEIDDQKLNKAIEMAQLSEVVSGLPQGVNTLIGENGVRLSGGQRQRVALARAFYYEREVIIMDEATSSLDNETEHEVINSIKSLHGVKTLIVIAHRLSTIQHCDVIYKLEKGRIIAQGTFDEVVNNMESAAISDE
ncbi:MAG: ABC transporter ATP-binding protein [Gammaproteobacteria bacterium]|nr:ABC transporter ATP-binding protein [Gammaproteobacteria bacterium]